jgi:hypothetical protein
VHNVRDKSARRGAKVTALSLCSPYNFLNKLKPAALLGLDAYIENPSVEVLKKIYDAINKCIDMAAIPRLSTFEKMLMYADDDDNKRYHIFSVQWPALGKKSAFDIPLHIPLFVQKEMIGDVNSLIPFLRAFGGVNTMVIFSAVLLEKRVMFVGSPEIEAGTVCEMVLAAANMLSPPFPLLPARTFPYANLNDLGFLDVPGYIAGVTNPLFKIKSEWWDILCDVETGMVWDESMLGEKQQPNSMAQKLMKAATFADDGIIQGLLANEADLQFIQKVISGVDQHLGEQFVHDEFTKYSRNIMQLMASFKSSGRKAGGDGPIESLMAASTQNSIRARLAEFEKTRMYQHAKTREAKTPGCAIGIDIRKSIRALKGSKKIEESELARMLGEILLVLQEKDDFVNFLYFMDNDVNALGICLFHKSGDVRALSCQILERLRVWPCSECAMKRMNGFYKHAFDQRKAGKGAGQLR